MMFRSKRKTLLLILSVAGILAGTVYYFFIYEPYTYFDFARFADLAEVSLDGKVFLKSGQAKMDQALDESKPPVLRVALAKSSTQRRAFYRIDRRNVRFRKRRVVFIQLHPATLQYYLKVPPQASLHFALIADGNSPASQAVTPSIQVMCAGGKKLSYQERMVIQQSENLNLRHDKNLDLSPVANEVCRFSFEIEPEGKLSPSTRIGWLDPRLITKSDPAKSEEKIGREYRTQIRQLRNLNQKSNLIIMLLDASNRSHFSTYGYQRNTTPVIDSLATQGITMDRAFCQSVFTLSSTADLFSSTTSLIHGVFNKEAKLLPEFMTLPEVLQKNGFRTASFTASANSSSTFGYDQGFQDMFELFRIRGGKALLAEKFISPVFQWLQKNASQRFFLYLHFREPHLPLVAPEPFRKMFDPDYSGTITGTFQVLDSINKGELIPPPEDIHHLVALYDSNIAYVDHVVGQILEKLREMKLYDNTVVLVLSDHGEALWEHGYQGHNIQVYEESIRIPMVLHLNHQDLPIRKRVDQMVRTIDVYPTMLDLFGIDRKSNPFAQGKSILPYFFSDSQNPDSMIFTHTVDQLDFSVRTERYKYIWSWDEKEAMYDLQTDPKETQNILEKNPVLAGYLRFQLKEFIAEQQEKRREYGIKQTEAPTIDPETHENLKALGYVN